MNYHLAKDIAVDLCYKLKPYCTKLHIAGSVRRKAPTVKDIEIICLAKSTPIKDLFENITGYIKDPGFITTVKGFGDIIKGKHFGRYMQIALPQHVCLDLFMPQEEDYYRQYAIRTGSSTYSRMDIATGWLKIGWVGTEDGLRRREDCEEIKQPDNKRIWKCIVEHPALPPVWQSEKEFFEWINVPWIDPEYRNSSVNSAQ